VGLGLAALAGGASAAAAVGRACPAAKAAGAGRRFSREAPLSAALAPGHRSARPVQRAAGKLPQRQLRRPPRASAPGDRRCAREDSYGGAFATRPLRFPVELFCA